jgi:hypothetical protein
MAAAELEVAMMAEEHVPRIDGKVDDGPPLSFARAEIESWLT